MSGEELSSAALLARVDISYRQLDYWTRNGAVEPSGCSADGPGTRRLWTRFDVDRLCVIIRARDLLGEMSTDLAGALWRWLGDRDRWPAFVTVTRGPGGRWMVRSGTGNGDLAAIVISTLTADVQGDLFAHDGPRRILDTKPL